MGRQPSESVICETCKRIPAGIVRPMQSSPCFFRRHVVMDGAAPAFDSNCRLPPSLCSCLRGFFPTHAAFPRGKYHKLSSITALSTLNNTVSYKYFRNPKEAPLNFPLAHTKWAGSPPQSVSSAKLASRSMQSSPCFFRYHVLMDGAAPASDSSSRLLPSLCSRLWSFSPHLLLFPGEQKGAVLFPSFFPHF
ncbi:hypothetical protein CDAR_267571 [Caerostris darwini]|uniref:Uncharacterized protein n=1 Tax=Caerostris darwini TaxID=1538125 RepID=A0AAV4THV4_9ARAC|nr:hypothetical protein CDAR_267571 [Caerostris darwini]